MLEVGFGVFIDENDIRESFVQASGPGGQHVNKTSTAVQLQLTLEAIQGLAPGARDRLVRLAGKRLTADGVLTLVCQSHRSQFLNRQEATERLVALVAQSLTAPKKRRPTKPSRSSQKRRLDEKGRRSQTKTLRKRVKNDD